MPEMDGFELCRRVKADLQYSHIPVLLLTAKPISLPKSKDCLGTGADLYVEKSSHWNTCVPAYPRSIEPERYAEPNRHLQNRRR